MALVTSAQFQNPRRGGGLAAGVRSLQGLTQAGLQREAIQRDEAIRQALSGEQLAPQTQQQQLLAEQSAGLGGALAQAEQPQLMTQAEMMETASKIDPFIAKKHFEARGIDSASKRAEASRFAAKIQGLPLESREAAISERANLLTSQGRDPKDTLDLLNLNEQQQNQALTNIQLMDLSTKERFDVQAVQAKAATKRIEAKDVKSSKILDDGTVITVLKDGNTVVTDPSGAELTGESRIQAVRDAQEFGVDVQQRRAKGRELGKGAGKIALTGFETVGKIKENILDLRRGIDLIEKEGATTGFVQDFLPNMRSSTRKFANLRRKLGLNVVASVTFGALSEGELKLAMDVALPKGISEEETVNWIKERIVAQEKLASNLQNAALFLADHSVAELIQRNLDMEKAAEKKAEGTETPTAQQATPTGRTATNPTTGEKLQEMSDGTWRAM